jgi:two-component system response regulator ResD
MRYKVMIVEDDFDTRNLMRIVLSKDYDVVLAENGQIALFHIQSEEWPDIIFLDHNMPIMNGPTFLGELKKQVPKAFETIPIILMTGHDRDFVKGIGVTEIMPKRGDLDAILAMIKKYCP